MNHGVKNVKHGKKKEKTVKMTDFTGGSYRDFPVDRKDSYPSDSTSTTSVIYARRRTSGLNVPTTGAQVTIIHLLYV